MLDIEGSFDLDGDPAVIRQMYRLGMRSVQLSAHNWTSNYADSCCSAPKWHGLNDRGREVIREMNRLGMVINVSHASDEAISAAIDASTDPVVATHHGLRAVNDIPRNMPDSLLKKLAAKGGVIGFQLGNEFHNRKAFEWATSHAGKAFWDTSAILQRGTQTPIYEIDKIVGPQFPMVPAAIPQEIRLTVDEWVGVVGPRDRVGGRRSCFAGQRFRWRSAAAARHARHTRSADDHRRHAAARVLRRADPEVSGRQFAARVSADYGEGKVDEYQAAARSAAGSGGLRVASHRPAREAREKVAMGRMTLGSRTPPNQTPGIRVAIAIAAMRAASRRRNSRRLSRTPPRQTRLPRRKAKYATFHQLPCVASSARKWLLAAMMARNCADTYTLSARFRGGS